MTNTCVCCGAEIPEGPMVCQACIDKAIPQCRDAAREVFNSLVPPKKKEAEYEAVEEALLTLKARLIYDIQKYEKDCINYDYRTGAIAFKIEACMVIDDLLNEYRRKRND